MYSFAYRQPLSVAEASAILKADSDAKLIAGGQTLLPSMRLRLIRPSQLIDLSAINDLRILETSAAQLTIGTMTRHSEIESDPRVRGTIPALSELAGMIGDPMVRNMGTIGGSVSNNDPAADYPAALLALHASIITDRRTIPAEGFFRGLFETALEPDEVVMSITVPAPQRAAYVKFRHPASRFALVGVFVAETAFGPRVAVTGAGASVFRVPDMEDALAKAFTPESIVGIRIPADDLNSDLHASAEYRANLVTVLAQRAVARAVARNQT